MPNVKKAALGLVITLVLGTTASSALADGQNGFIEEAVAQGQSVVFKDDPLAAGGLDANDAMIKARPPAVRMFLLRPRTQFVMEMIKSVENL